MVPPSPSTQRVGRISSSIYLSAAIALGLRVGAKGAQVGVAAERRGSLWFCTFSIAGAKATWPLVMRPVKALAQVLLLNHHSYRVKFVPLYPFYGGEMRIQELRGGSGLLLSYRL